MNYSSRLMLMMSIALWTTKLFEVLGAEPQVPCYFLFGDSIVDNGNNNDVVNSADKANYPPYGLDLPAVPRGRFTNGRTVTDLLGQFLGFEELIPPFLTARGNETLRGLNYASGGSGIRDETGNSEILYNNGARKIALFGLGELGCIPILINGTLCLETINSISALFNTRLVSLVHHLNQRYPDAMFTYISSRSNTSLTALDEIPNYGPCCEVASGEGGCSRNGSVCANRSEYLFWDAIHPSEAANMIYANAAYNATSPSDACPFDIRHLAEGRPKWRI